MKGLMKVFSTGLAILKEWGMIGLPKRNIWERLCGEEASSSYFTV